MTLPKEQYKAFEAIVGPENISDDPVDLDAWAWRTGQFALLQEFKPRFEAIVMPGSTEEVAAIVRLCNKHKVAFRPVCTGWSGQFAANTLYIDLRRLNRIIEINEKHMYAVVEPYVITAQLQAELFKRGFHMNVKGAGANCTAMLRGHGHLDQTTSGDDRNHLAIEWVTPEGNLVNILRVNSLPVVDRAAVVQISDGGRKVRFDPQTGFISVKSKDGKQLKALELPGLWNGAMSNWNTIFVEVPLATFSPVKTVNDLLREEHQPCR